MRLRGGTGGAVPLGDGRLRGLLGAGLLHLDDLHGAQHLRPLLTEGVERGGLLEELDGTLGVQEQVQVAEGLLPPAHVGLAPDLGDLVLGLPDGLLRLEEGELGGLRLLGRGVERGLRGERVPAGGLGLEGHPLELLLGLGTRPPSAAISAATASCWERAASTRASSAGAAVAAGMPTNAAASSVAAIRGVRRRRRRGEGGGVQVVQRSPRRRFSIPHVRLPS